MKSFRTIGALLLLLLSFNVQAQEEEFIPRKMWTFRVGLLEGLGAEYSADLSKTWQVAGHGSTWLIFSELGGDVRYFLKRNPRTGYYVGTGLHLLNSPLLFDVAIGPHIEFGFERMSRNGFYFAAGIGGTALYIPQDSTGLFFMGPPKGWQGVAPGFHIRLRKIKAN